MEIVAIIFLILFVIFVKFIWSIVSTISSESQKWKKIGEEEAQRKSRKLDNLKKIKGLESREPDESYSEEELELFEDYFSILKNQYPELEYEYECMYVYGGDQYYVTVHNVSAQLSKEIGEWEYENLPEKRV